MGKSINPKIKKGKAHKNGAAATLHSNLNKNGRPPKRVDSIVFDAAARRAHLVGSSTRKRERRAYGLAMQHVKNRTAKLQNRASLRTAAQERIEAAEASARLVHDEEHAHAAASTRDDARVEHDAAMELDETPTTTLPATLVVQYEGQETQEHWGGRVVVTTSTHIPVSDDESHESDIDDNTPKPPPRVQRNRDVQQEYAGQVEKYLKKIKGSMPAKKRSLANAGGGASSKRGGTHGAAGMKGVGNAGTLKVAQKVLARSTAKLPKGKPGVTKKRGKR